VAILICKNPITDDGIKELFQLTHLNISSNKSITNTGIKDLTNISPLDLSSNLNITNEGIRKLNLTYLNLSYNGCITDV
jgi:hypothetical protein